jgi:thioester reductase-like protein
MNTIFLTGGTGFLGKELLARFLAQPDSTLYALCRKGSEVKLKSFLSDSQLDGRLKVIEGDITLPGLGMDPRLFEELAQRDIEIVHCAAAYDLAVRRETAGQVNIEGTRNMLAFAASLPRLRRFHHISSIVVSGDRNGKVYEDELDKGQGFNNHYEYSKFHAEKEVAQYSDRIPVTVHRPAVIIGASTDGFTEKFDGPYFVMKLMLTRLPVLVPGSGNVPLNLAPVDFVADTIVEIARHEDTIGKTFHVCDPHPETLLEITNRALKQLRGKNSVVHVPANSMRLISALPFFASITHVPPELIPYMCKDTYYDTTNTAEILKRSEKQCPPISTYFDRTVRFFQKNAL